MFRSVIAECKPSRRIIGQGKLYQPLIVSFIVLVLGVVSQDIKAQEVEPLLQPGEAYATRFSGITAEDGKIVILPEGVVGSIVDIRNPGTAPKGQHWVNEPQRMPVTAAEVGQVFGVALDDQAPPNVFLTATSAFGLHRSADNSDWLSGMWGPDGGPGTVYKLDKDNNYTPEVFANITLEDRENSGAALGNIAYDKWNKQLYVSDLETGMIHRLSADDGKDLGHFDHGVEGRTKFFDATTDASADLQPVAFDPSSTVQTDACSAGQFSVTPECWNYADFRRRVWGLGVRRDESSEEVRLYYAIWASQGLGNPDWAAAEDDKRNSVWSVRIADDGGFDTSSVRREFFLPDFFVNPEDIARVGYSHPVADIAFPKCAEQNIMVVSERGGVRNKGLQSEEAFAFPHEARVIRYELNEEGLWQSVGRYDVGYYERALEGSPFLRANSSGGVDFGLGYTQDGLVNSEKLNEFLWMTGDALCSSKPNGACVNPDTGAHDDTSAVHGVQGLLAEIYAEMAPAAAYEAYPSNGPATSPEGPDQSWLIDLDINVDETGAPIEQELTRNDATTIGDVEIYVPCAAPVEETGVVPPPLHSTIRTHRRWGSPEHSARITHRRWGSPQHTRRATHRRWGSPQHTRRATHRRWGSPQHTRRATHRRWGSPQHTRRATHRRWGSPQHTRRATHRRWGSPQHTRRATHRRQGSPQHTRRATHRRQGSPQHTRRATHRRQGSPQHTRRATHRRQGSPQHTRRATHRRQGSPQHTRRATHRRQGSPQHTRRATHRRQGSPQHTRRATHRRQGSPQHTRRATHRRQGSPQHTRRATHRRQGSPQHTRRATHRRQGSPQHTRRATHRRQGSPQHTRRATHRRQGSPQHTRRATHRRQGSPQQGLRRLDQIR